MLLLEGCCSIFGNIPTDFLRFTSTTARSTFMMHSAACATSVCFSRYRYTAKKRDTESGLDYFGARYYASSMGRFMSPDPSGIAYSNPTNPQSFNLYSYALNNPLRFVDPTGLKACFYGGQGDTPQNDHDASDYEDVPDQAYVRHRTRLRQQCAARWQAPRADRRSPTAC